MRWIAGRIVSTRLMAKGPVTIRRSLACSGSSMLMKVLACSRRARVASVGWG